MVIENAQINDVEKYGIAVSGTKSCVIKKCQINNCKNSSIVAYDYSNVIVTNNRISQIGKFCFNVFNGGIISAEQNIIHCDLNTDNVYLDSSFYPKVNGFEYSKTPLNMTVNRIISPNLIQEYSAPEVLLNQNYSKSSDIYSFGVVCSEILTKKKPFEELKTTIHLIKEVAIDRKRPDDFGISKFYQNLINRCWSQDPTERPSFDEIVELLKNNSELKDDEEYQQYIKMVESSEINYDETKKTDQFDEIIGRKESSQKVEFFCEQP